MTINTLRAAVVALAKARDDQDRERILQRISPLWRETAQREARLEIEKRRCAVQNCAADRNPYRRVELYPKSWRRQMRKRLDEMFRS